MLHQEENGTPVIQRKTIYTPPRSWRNWLFGRPLATADAPHQTIGKFLGLAVFSSDALSSVAYGPQEVLLILAISGVGSFRVALPISFSIILLLVILTLSYEQTIHAYPDGGGSYIVARDNIGVFPSLIAGASLLIDYILTVSVSISSGVAQIVSAFPNLYSYRVMISIFFVLLVMVINLRGVKESGIAFAFPTYFFLGVMFFTVIFGFLRYLIGNLGPVYNPPQLDAPQVLQPLSLFLILRAFASGTTTLTGVEAISNGITAFKEPRSRNAGITLIWMAGILAVLMLGVFFLSHVTSAIPSESETIISQLARTIFNGRSLLYYSIIVGTTVILIMAANTAYADFPRLSAIAARDGFLPRQMSYRGSRLVFSYGIVTLGLIASLLIVIFQASVNRLIPLYAIGVFLAFTLSQAGMAHRWWKIGQLQPGQEIIERGSTLRQGKNWQVKMFINGFGAICTAVVVLVFSITKFAEGAWVVLLLLPILITMFSIIHRHYRNVGNRLSLDSYAGVPPRATRHRVLMPLSGVHQGTLEALRYARHLSDDVTAVHVSIDPEETEKIRQRWEIWGEGVRLVILDSPYRLFIEPLLEYIEEISTQRQPGETITIVVPQFIPSKSWHRLLHTNTANLLRSELLNKPGIIITDVPYLVP
jgi:amino acid transporter